MSDPRAEYSSRLEQRRGVAARLAARERAIGNARLGVFLLAAVLGWLAFASHVLAQGWLALPAAAFIALVVHHDRVIKARRHAERSVAFYERGLARVDDRWAGNGETGDRFLDPKHPYAADLDLFGHGSLFQLLCTARTRGGEDTLAAWLCHPAAPDTIRGRHGAVGELRPRLDLREELALLGADVRAGLHPEALAAWSTAPILLGSGAARWTAATLCALTIMAGALWVAGAGLLPLLLMLAIEAAFALRLRRRVLQIIRAVQLPVQDLTVLVELLARLEREPFSAPRLTALRAQLDADGAPPSAQIARLQRYIHLLDARKNQIFAALAPLLLWTTQIAFAIEAWRAASGAAVPRWIAAVGELEALGALASYAYEHPSDPFPEVVSDKSSWFDELTMSGTDELVLSAVEGLTMSGTEEPVLSAVDELTVSGPVFDGVALGHPLIPVARCVRNDAYLGSDRRVLIVSGSNMSGKSTLLRTVGTNAVLALAGAPVRAERLRLSPLAVGASIRLQDSLQAGSSRFYAEITRLRQLVDIAQSAPPLLFLLDEILHGTNSHDRRIGAEAVVRGLVELGAVGLVTTHDLALAHIADTLAPHAANVHFADHLENGRMVFDYRMRPGVVAKSNALELMRAVGLRVPGA